MLMTNIHCSIRLFVSLMSMNLFVQDFGKDVKVQIYAPLTANIDGNLAILWLLAVCTVAVGAYWAGVSNKKAM